MQAVSRQLGHQSLKLLPAISSLNSIYQLTDHHYGNDHPRYASTLTTKGVGHLVCKGTGGRSSVSGIITTVFGATGFLGRYVVQQLAKMGSQVFVPFRGSEDPHRHLKLMVPFIVYLNSVLLTLILQIVPMKYNPRDENSIKAVMAKANVVINLIGREYETHNYSFEEVNQYMAEQSAVIAKEHGGIMRFIQVSCLGASSSSPSRMLRAKAAAEEAIMREIREALFYIRKVVMETRRRQCSLNDVAMLELLLMIGTEDRILNRWAQFAKNYGFLPLIGDGSTNIQPVYVVDVASAIVTALNDDCTSMGKVFELGGPEVFTVHELAELMYDMIREWPRYVKVPFPIAKVRDKSVLTSDAVFNSTSFSFICKAIAMPREMFLNKVPFPLPTPTIFNLDEINALTQDTVVSPDALTFDDLGIMPRKLKGYPVEFLIQYRKGGPQYGSTVSEKVSPDAWPSKSSVL